MAGKRISILFTILFFSYSTNVFAEEYYSSTIVNQSNEEKQQYTLIKTKTWPKSGCILDSGQEMLLPGEKTKLIILKKKSCEQAGVGYSLYKEQDILKENLLGYVSHRFHDGTFSLQVSAFCYNDKCNFRDLNPDQIRKSPISIDSSIDKH